MGLDIIILVCKLSLAHAACTQDSARAAIHGPTVDNEIECGFIGQATIAQTAAEVRPDPKTEYTKIVCPFSSKRG